MYNIININVMILICKILLICNENVLILMM